jgi:hypothetical protein
MTAKSAAPKLNGRREKIRLEEMLSKADQIFSRLLIRGELDIPKYHW